MSGTERMLGSGRDDLVAEDTETDYAAVAPTPAVEQPALLAVLGQQAQLLAMLSWSVRVGVAAQGPSVSGDTVPAGGPVPPSTHLPGIATWAAFANWADATATDLAHLLDERN
jgi:hypothetical protein